MTSYRVLVVEDEELAAEAHATYVGRVDGFELAGVARSAGEAARFLEQDREVDRMLEESGISNADQDVEIGAASGY